MAQVYLGHHDGLGRQVAVKRLRRQFADMEEARARLRAEAEIGRALRHDHIVDFLDLVTDPTGDTYLIMEHLAGEPLATRLARAGALPLSETLVVGLQIADALETVHRRGIVHRDLKTENVLVGLDTAGQLLAKLIDFGVAEIVSSNGMIQPPTVVGTPESMSPEQAMAAPLDHRSDIYSFGVLLYEMVTGAPPFQGDELEELLARIVAETPVPPSKTAGAQKQLIPEALERLILDCLSKRAADRPRDMSVVRARLQQIEDEYRALGEALDSAVVDGVADIDRMVKQALIVVEEVVETPAPAPSPVRAVGTGPATGRLAARSRKPAVRSVGTAAWSGELLIDAEPEPVVTMPRADETAKANRMRSRMRRIARAGLLVAIVAAGVGGLMGYIAGAPEALTDLPAEMEHR